MEWRSWIYDTELKGTIVLMQKLKPGTLAKTDCSGPAAICNVAAIYI